jgi:hypothetical protein
MATTIEVGGSCHCGAVRFRIRFPTRFFAHCHCDDCRRAHGAAFVSWVGVPETQLELDAGAAEHLVRYDSSPAASRQFCRRCGTTLTFAGERWPNEIHVVAASLHGPIDREPQAHTYFDRAVDWVHLADDLPRLGGATGVEPLVGVPDP